MMLSEITGFIIGTYAGNKALLKSLPGLKSGHNHSWGTGGAILYGIYLLACGTGGAFCGNITERCLNKTI
jgi:hypothetical protein